MKRGGAFWLVWLTAGCAAGQTFSQRGFLEATGAFYPEAAPNDSAHAVGEAQFRYEAFWKPFAGLQFAGGIAARADSHWQTARDGHFSWLDREPRRPAFALRRLSASYTRGKLAVEAGRQFIRWGKTDVLNPTDRFAPRDFLGVVDTEVLGVAAVRATYGGQSDSLDLVCAPWFTPSRVPLFDQRWAVLPPGVAVLDLGASYPGRAQFGARWNHIGGPAEYSVSFYDGFNHLPLFDTAAGRYATEVAVRRFYPRLRMYGADAAIPMRALTLKAEAGYFTSASRQADDYLLYVIQLERQAGEWFFVGGYAGQVVTEHRSAFQFAPDRGLTRAFVARAGYTIDTNRSLALETAVRQNGKGVWVKAEYSQALGGHWRATAAWTLLRGREDDFLGQYHRNSQGKLGLRYSF